MTAEQERFIEELLDSSLREFSASAEPRPGLEERIVTRIEAADLPACGWSWRWLWAAAALAGCLALMWVMWPASTTEPAPEIVSSKKPPAPKVGRELASSSILPVQKTKKNALGLELIPRTIAGPARDSTVSESATALPKLEVFPSPAPLSDEERRILTFAERTPESELITLSQIQQEQQKEADRILEPYPLTNQNLNNHENHLSNGGMR